MRAQAARGAALKHETQAPRWLGDRGSLWQNAGDGCLRIKRSQVRILPGAPNFRSTGRFQRRSPGGYPGDRSFCSRFVALFPAVAIDEEFAQPIDLGISRKTRGRERFLDQIHA